MPIDAQAGMTYIPDKEWWEGWKPLVPPTSAIISDTSGSVYSLTWQRERDKIKKTLEERFWIQDENTVMSVVNGVTDTWLFEDIINSWIGALISMLTSKQYDTLIAMITQKDFKIQTFEERLQHYARYPVRRKFLAEDRYNEFLSYLRDDVYFKPQAQKYDEHISAMNTLLQELGKKNIRKSRKDEIYRDLYEKAQYVSNSIIRNKNTWQN